MHRESVQSSSPICHLENMAQCVFPPILSSPKTPLSHEDQSCYLIFMSTEKKLTGKVKNGVIPPPGLKLADGTAVELIPLAPLPVDPAFLKTALKLAKPRNWPRDFALNHGHYVKQRPKK